MPVSGFPSMLLLQGAEQAGDARALVRAQAQAEAAQARAEGEAARMQAEMAREQARMARDQAQAIRDAVREATRAQRGVTMVPPMHGLTRRQEGMLFTGFLFVTMAAVAVLYPIFRAFGRRLEGAPRQDALGADAAERLLRIEQAVEAMAIEIERISEGQRFTTRLLADRAERADAELRLGR